MLKLVLTTTILFVMTSLDAQNKHIEKATIGSGCFWCTEAIFTRLSGVVSTSPGYSGGHVKNPSYKEVCSGNTGHAEVIRVEFDSSIISYADILKVFWNTHDPTTLNRQGADVGTQYRSVIFYHSEEQKSIAEKLLKDLDEQQIWNDPIVTAIEEYVNYYPAENYHDDYYMNNPNEGYCRFVITPKVEKFEKVFKDYLKSKP
jgi:peptide-methionine (S)-S-oxide reductase